MEKNSLTALIHNRQECIGIYFAMHTKLNAAIKTLPQIKWSKTNKCWYVYRPPHSEHCMLLTQCF
jgi:hypothetical protein